ncbi:MAG: PKD domain-containing protein [Bacteroidetes bacterium]|nr:PKD domain-containing protein [Bacteroidota bacterium]
MNKGLLIGTLLLLTTIIITQYSCKQATEDIIQCAAESIGVSINADLDSQTPNLMHFKFNYNSSNGTTLQQIIWNFGDGTVITNSDTIIDHTYTNSGHYDASMAYTVKINNNTCSSSTTKSINIP